MTDREQSFRLDAIRASMRTNQLLGAALIKAADWLEANPDKHITDVLARDKEQRRVNPISSEAVCFCAVGRVCRELELPGVGYLPHRFANKLGAIASLNDNMKHIPHRPNYDGKAAAIAKLREFARDII